MLESFRSALKGAFGMESKGVLGAIQAEGLYNRIRDIQEDQNKAAINGILSGSVFYPQPFGNIREIHVEPVLGALQEPGLTSDDVKDGMLLFYKANLKDPRSMYGRELGGADYDEITDWIWLTSQGKALAADIVDDQRSWREVPLDPQYQDTLIKVVDLSIIPSSILANFGSYEAFKQALGPNVDTNGIDHFAWSSGEEWPWIPFAVKDQLKGFVDALDPKNGDRIDSNDWRLQQSLGGRPRDNSK